MLLVNCLSYSGIALLHHVCDSFAHGMDGFCNCSVSNRFLNSSRISIFFDPIRMASILGGHIVINFFLSASTSSLMLLIAILWSVQMLMTLTPAC